jgi:hypothetical protein
VDAKGVTAVVGRQAANAFVIDNKVYVGLGARDVTAQHSATLYNDWYRYDPITDTWTAIASFPGPRASPRTRSASTDRLRVLRCGPQRQHQVIYNDGWAYDPVNDQWLMLGLFPGVPWTAASPSPQHIGLHRHGVRRSLRSRLGPPGAHRCLLGVQTGGIAGIEEEHATGWPARHQQGDHLVIDLPQMHGGGTIDLRDALGKIVRSPMKVARNTARVSIDASALATGLYIVRWDAEERSISERVVLE